MALPVLDGNQSATTLSSVVTGGEHIVAHSVVSLGANAIANITSAVSGSVVSVSNFPSTQTIAGTVTANVTNSVTIGAIIGPAGGNCLRGISVSGDAVRSILSVRDVTGSYSEIISNANGVANLPIYGTVTIGNTVTIGSLPAISGTVTVGNATTASAVFTKICGERQGAGSNEARELVSDDNGKLIVTIQPSNSQNDVAEYDGAIGNAYIKTKVVAGSVTIGSNPSGALTTRFGSVTTANTAQLTSAVTNTSRKYLLLQNIATATVTIGIGFAPTTTQGIQLTAGAGLTFDAFCPTGGVWWLSAVTGSNFSILEG